MDDKDTIYRQEAIDALLELVEARRTWINTENARKEISGIDASMCAIHDLPSAQPERKKGEWLDMGDFEQCSVCGGTHLKEFQSYYGKTKWIKTNYCPNCGVVMDGESDETD